MNESLKRKLIQLLVDHEECEIRLCDQDGAASDDDIVVKEIREVLAKLRLEPTE